MYRIVTQWGGLYGRELVLWPRAYPTLSLALFDVHGTADSWHEIDGARLDYYDRSILMTRGERRIAWTVIDAEHVPAISIGGK